LPPANPPQVLYEDNHLLAINKPAGLPTMGAPAGAATLVTWAQDYLRRRYHKPGNVYIGVVSRLDASTTGVVLLARTSKAAGRLSEQFRTRAVSKTYWAVVEGLVKPSEEECRDWLLKDEAAHRMRCVAATAAGAQEARLSYRRLAEREAISVLEVELHTGRKHQIRVQLARRGHPILGDAKYGSRQPFSAGIALHARRLALVHPVRGEQLTLLAPLPPSWRAWTGVLPPPPENRPLGADDGEG